MKLYELKLKTARLCKGIRLKCLLLRLAFFSVFFSACVCLITAVLHLCYGADGISGGVLGLIGVPVNDVSCTVFTAVLFAAGAFLSVCAAALSFTLKAEFFYAADKNQSRPKSFLSFGNGIRFLRYRIIVLAKKTALFIRFMFPFGLQVFIVALIMNIYGLERFSTAVCGIVLLFTLVFSLFCFFVRCRLYDTGVYLMYLNRMLSPSDAVLSSEEKTAGRLLSLAVYKIWLIPKKIAGLFFMSSVFAVPFAGVFNALVCEKLYGENKKKVKQPAVTFFINKKTKMMLPETTGE